MSWMDSWSRPNKSSATPPPLYLTRDDVKYCSTCGRVIGERRSHQKNKVVKYCSDGCREHRPGPMDRKIEKAILALLLGEEGSGLDTTGASGRFRKGDRRNVITCDEIERLVFERPPEAKGDKQSKDSFELTDEDENEADETMEDGESRNAPVSSEDQKAELAEKQKAGQKRAREREMVRRAARRAVVFGLVVDEAETASPKAKGNPEKSSKTDTADLPRRKCEALMNGQIVEPSFAKGNWAIRWRE